MHHNQIGLVLRLPEELRDRTEDKGIADSVESVLPQSM